VTIHFDVPIDGMNVMLMWANDAGGLSTEIFQVSQWEVFILLNRSTDLALAFRPCRAPALMP
jgi:hypothetical protein